VKVYNNYSVQDVICNKCAQSLKRTWDGLTSSDIHTDMYGVKSIEYTGGYLSGPHIRDMDHLEFSICENCLGDFVQSFKLSPRDSLWNRDSLQAIFQAQTIAELAVYLTDENLQVRQYATARIEHLQKGEEK
jgi:protein-arginine kinase activator protein McsA